VTHFRVNSPNVIHEIIDGEAVIVNLQNGSYYSIDKIGAVVWSYLEKGLSMSQIIDIIAVKYSGEAAAIKHALEQLFAQLQDEQLIVPVETAPSNGDFSDVRGAANGEIKPQFEAPVLHKYTDMEDLLLLDPIHDVDETGWPNVPEKK
jgi:hypothetical protein